MKMFYKNFRIIYLKEIDSTNNFAKNFLKQNKVFENTVILTDYQTKGRGQKNNIWLSQKRKNLTFSIIVFPKIKVEDQFFLLMATSLAIIDCLSKHVNNIKLKWPNDIYLNNKKLGGILIENVIKNNIIESSVIGIGLNINQVIFDKDLNAISLKIINKKSYNRIKILKELLDKFEIRLNTLKSLNNTIRKDLKNEYLKNLLFLKQWHLYTLPSGKNLAGKIIGVQEDGKLIIQDKNKHNHYFNFKEIIF